jgi:ABC-2 type transport system permease protein
VRAAAPAHRRTAALGAMELRLALRNGENLLVAFGIPAGLLVFFSLVDVLPAGDGPVVDFLLPGVLVAAVMGSALVALAITTGFERSVLVLKRLGATPLRRHELVAGKVLAVVAIQGLQVTVLVGAALALGWPVEARPGLSGVLVGAAALALGTAAFAGVGLAMAGALPATTTLALSNAVFVVLLLGTGLLFPVDVLPGPAAAAAEATPSHALAEVLRSALGGTGVAARPLGVLAVWALAGPVVAARLFRWW